MYSHPFIFKAPYSYSMIFLSTFGLIHMPCRTDKREPCSLNIVFNRTDSFQRIIFFNDIISSTDFANMKIWLK